MKRLGLPLAILALCVVLLRKLPLEQVVLALHQARPGCLALCAVIYPPLNNAACTQRFRMLLQQVLHRGAGVSFLEALGLVLSGSAASNLLPARACEAVRALTLHRRHGYPIDGVVAARLVEVLVAAAGLGLWSLLALLLSPPKALRGPLWITAVLGLGIIALSALLARLRQPLHAGRRGFLLRLAASVQLIHAPYNLLRALGYSLASDVTEMLTIRMCLEACGIQVPPATGLAVFVAINAISVLPAVPGQLGVMEVGVVLVLGAAGIGGAPALAAVLLFHVLQLVPVTLAGALLLPRHLVATTRRPCRPSAAPAGP